VYLLIKIKYIYIVNFSNYFSDLVSILLKPKTKNQKPKTKNQKPKTKNQKPKTETIFRKKIQRGWATEYSQTRIRINVTG
jgi:hypothetical protein